MLANSVLLAADTGLTDGLIISRVLEGNTDFYEVLVRRYNNLLYKTAHGILHDEEDIEDVMQEAYIKGFTHLHQFKGTARFSTWLTRILINCALQHVSKLKNSQAISIDEVVEDENEELGIDATESGKDEIGENLTKALEGAINHLPVKYRAVFMMREVEEMPIAEVASLLNISEENVKIRSHRAKNMLKELLRPKLNSMEIFEFHASRCTPFTERLMARIHQMVSSKPCC